LSESLTLAFLWSIVISDEMSDLSSRVMSVTRSPSGLKNIRIAQENFGFVVGDVCSPAVARFLSLTICVQLSVDSSMT
jgi:hypothetical protein